jgi:hypothetical protein
MKGASQQELIKLTAVGDIKIIHIVVKDFVLQSLIVIYFRSGKNKGLKLNDY